MPSGPRHADASAPQRGAPGRNESDVVLTVETLEAQSFELVLSLQAPDESHANSEPPTTAVECSNIDNHTSKQWRNAGSRRQGVQIMRLVDNDGRASLTLSIEGSGVPATSDQDAGPT